MPNYVYYLDHQNKNITSIKSPFESSALHASLSFWDGDIKLVMQITPASAKSFATSPEIF